jgi:hypothetical protein
VRPLRLVLAAGAVAALLAAAGSVAYGLLLVLAIPESDTATSSLLAAGAGLLAVGCGLAAVGWLLLRRAFAPPRDDEPTRPVAR